MWGVGLSALFALSVALLLCRVVGQFQQYRRLRLEEEPVEAGTIPEVTIVIPARNESSNIGACLAALSHQSIPRDRLRIIVVDDSSVDDTAAVIRHYAARDDRITLVEAPPLPVGWTGKPHACWHGALAARSAWLCFIDADTIAEPGLLRAALAAAVRRHLDLLSLEPFQELSGILDRLVMPLGFLALAATHDVARLSGAKAEAVEVNGQFILCRAEAYFSVGGHAAVGDAICEDRALARRFAATGFRIAVLAAENLIRTRMYRSARELWEGLSKNLIEVFGGIGPTLGAAVGAALLSWAAVLLPISATAEAVRAPIPAHIVAWLLAVPASLALFAMTIALGRHFRLPFWYGLLSPLGSLIGALIATNAILSRARGRVTWKGRDYGYSRS